MTTRSGNRALVQIRDVPEAVRDELARKAAAPGSVDLAILGIAWLLVLV